MSDNENMAEYMDSINPVCIKTSVLLLPTRAHLAGQVSELLFTSHSSAEGE